MKRCFFLCGDGNEAGASAAPVPRARGVPPLDSGLRSGWDGKSRLFPHEAWGNEKLKNTMKIIHGLSENIKTPEEKASFLLRRFFVFPDALHPLGGNPPPGPWMSTTKLRFAGSSRVIAPHVFITVFPTLQRETVCRKSTPVPLLGPGTMSLVRGLGLNKPHRSPSSTGTEAD